MKEEEKELEVDVETTARAEPIIELLESTIAGLKNCTHWFRLEMRIRDLGNNKAGGREGRVC